MMMDKTRMTWCETKMKTGQELQEGAGTLDAEMMMNEDEESNVSSEDSSVRS